MGIIEEANLSFAAESTRRGFFPLDWLVRPNDRAVFESDTSSSAMSSPPSPAETNSQAPRIATTGTPLNVPFADKDQAKALGAQWHADQKRWIVPAGRDLTPFSSWLD